MPGVQFINLRQEPDLKNEGLMKMSNQLLTLLGQAELKKEKAARGMVSQAVLDHITSGGSLDGIPQVLDSLNLPKSEGGLLAGVMSAFGSSPDQQALDRAKGRAAEGMLGQVMRQRATDISKEVTFLQKVAAGTFDNDGLEKTDPQSVRLRNWATQEINKLIFGDENGPAKKKGKAKISVQQAAGLLAPKSESGKKLIPKGKPTKKKTKASGKVKKNFLVGKDIHGNDIILGKRQADGTITLNPAGRAKAPKGLESVWKGMSEEEKTIAVNFLDQGGSVQAILEKLSGGK